MLSRKNRMSVSGIAVLLLFEVFQAQAQNPPPGPVLPPLFQYNPRAISEAPLYQERKLEMTMTTDRTVYFTGEQLEVTVTIRNPTREKLTVDEPFVYGTGGILTQRRPLGSTSDGDWQVESPHPIEYRAPDPPKIVIAAGQRIQKTMRIPEDCPSARYFAWPCGVFSREGEYRYGYGYGPGISVEFRVVRPVMELLAEVKLNKKFDYVHWEKRQGKNVPTDRVSRLDRFSVVYVVEHLRTRYLITWQRPGGAIDRARLKMDPGSAPLCPCVRLPYSGKRAARLDASVNPADHLLIEVTDEAGTTSRIRLNEKREIIPD